MQTCLTCLMFTVKGNKLLPLMSFSKDFSKNLLFCIELIHLGSCHFSFWLPWKCALEMSQEIWLHFGRPFFFFLFGLLQGPEAWAEDGEGGGGGADTCEIRRLSLWTAAHSWPLAIRKLTTTTANKALDFQLPPDALKENVGINTYI